MYYFLFSVVREWSRFWECSNVCLCLCLGARLHCMETLAGFCCVSIIFSVVVRFAFGGASTSAHVYWTRACICRASVRSCACDTKKRRNWTCTRMNAVSRTASTKQPSVHGTRNQYRNRRTHAHTQCMDYLFWCPKKIFITSYRLFRFDFLHLPRTLAHKYTHYMRSVRYRTLRIRLHENYTKIGAEMICFGRDCNLIDFSVLSAFRCSKFIEFNNPHNQFMGNKIKSINLIE